MPDGVDAHRGRLGQVVLALDHQGAQGAGGVEGEAFSQGDGFDPRQAGGTIQGPAVELSALGLGVVLGTEVEREEGDFVGFEPGVDLLRLAQAAQEEAGGDQHHEAEGDLSAHQEVSQTEQAVRAAGCADFALDHRGHVGPRGPQGRRQAEEHPRGEHQKKEESQDSQIEAEVQTVLGEVGRFEGPQQPRAPEADHTSQNAADQGERAVFEKQLPDQLPAPGAERQPQRHLSLPGGRSGQEQVGQIGARDHQHQQHRDHQNRAAGDQEIAVARIESGLG